MNPGRRLLSSPHLRFISLLLAALVVQACSSGGSADPVTPPPPPPPPVTNADLIEASRFSSRATFGLPYQEIEALARQGKQAWLDEQFSQPIGDHQPVVDELIARRDRGDFAEFEEDVELLFVFRRLAWWHRTMTSPDVLRQRVAFALSEIFVVSDNVDALVINPYALSGYYDMLLTDAFGNFRDLLRSVTLHPSMGIYLSHVNNRKADPANNTFPDENYAREVMQLFSIGLFELNIDGSLELDVNGDPIPTYSNTEIREFAKVFTGLSYSGSGAFFGNPQPNFQSPMTMFDEFHEPGEKRLLNGTIIPSGQTGMQDLEAAIDNLFNHPNVGPFIGKQLIQRLVTSNPSPAYVERVARAFNGDTTGVRGDMQAVLRAVLLDAEAAAAPASTGSFGKLREPVVRYAALARQLNAASKDGFFANTGIFLQALTRQHPLSSPSVFNFFLPAHSPAGEIADASLVAPEFEITTNTTVVGISNLIDLAVTVEFIVDTQAPPFGEVSLDLGEYIALANDIEALLDRLDVVFTYGTLSAETRSAIRGVLADIEDDEFRIRTALYLLLISPDYAVRI